MKFNIYMDSFIKLLGLGQMKIKYFFFHLNMQNINEICVIYFNIALDSYFITNDYSY